MILVFGGTTEGRKAIKELEESGNTYYYSTKTGEQDVTLHHGVCINGTLDREAMLAFCHDHDIRLLIDAAHPFAEVLHQTVCDVAAERRLPVVRFDRIYPAHDNDLIWCKDYDDAMRQMEAERISRLLALTGANTISKLRPYWEKHADCWFRILNRQASKRVAAANDFPEEHLVYYETDDTSVLINELHPQAIITKESGMSGGFLEKVEAARRADVKVFVVERPVYPPQTPHPQYVKIEYVNGEHGLRRAVEKLLPEFFPLHSGLTTGTCATAAAVAAALQQLTQHPIPYFRPPARSLSPSTFPPEVPVILPNGETIHVPVHYAEDYAYVIKDSGDDPDVTKGIEIRASLTPDPSPKGEGSIEIEGGEGIGRFTLPGFDFPPGEPAINKGPRQMIRQNLSALLSSLHLIPEQNSPARSLSPSTLHPLTVTLSVPNGAEIARRTFNPRLGIEGGISIIGVSGIIKPFSEEAFIDSIRKCMQVAKASGAERVVINSGAKSERYVKSLYPDLPPQAFVEYGNYIGETLKIADELGIPQVTLGVMLGKAVKLADGQLDTHSRKGTMNKTFIAQMLAEASLHNSNVKIQNSKIKNITLARELWELIPASQLQTFADVVIAHCQEHCAPLLPNGELTILLISDDGDIFRHSNSSAIG